MPASTSRCARVGGLGKPDDAGANRCRRSRRAAPAHATVVRSSSPSLGTVLPPWLRSHRCGEIAAVPEHAVGHRVTPPRGWERGEVPSRTAWTAGVGAPPHVGDRQPALQGERRLRQQRGHQLPARCGRRHRHPLFAAADQSFLPVAAGARHARRARIGHQRRGQAGSHTRAVRTGLTTYRTYRKSRCGYGIIPGFGSGRGDAAISQPTRTGQVPPDNQGRYDDGKTESAHDEDGPPACRAQRRREQAQGYRHEPDAG